MKFKDLLKIIDLDNNKTIHLVENSKMILDLELNKFIYNIIIKETKKQKIETQNKKQFLPKYKFKANEN